MQSPAATAESPGIKIAGIQGAGDSGSENGSLPTSTCNDIEEHGIELAKMPKSSKTAGTFQRLNEQRPKEVSQWSFAQAKTPHISRGQMPTMKSMDVSEMGFRERY